MTNIDALVATNLWWTERKEKGAHHYVLRIYRSLFQTLDALYIETHKLPLNCNSFAISKLGQTLYFTFCKVKDNFR